MSFDQHCATRWLESHLSSDDAVASTAVEKDRLTKEDRVGQVWRVLGDGEDENDPHQVALVLVVESYPSDDARSWMSYAHRCVVLWELHAGYASSCMNTDPEGRFWLMDGDRGFVEREL